MFTVFRWIISTFLDYRCMSRTAAHFGGDPAVCVCGNRIGCFWRDILTTTSVSEKSCESCCKSGTNGCDVHVSAYFWPCILKPQAVFGLILCRALRAVIMQSAMCLFLLFRFRRFEFTVHSLLCHLFLRFLRADVVVINIAHHSHRSHNKDLCLAL